MHFRSGGVDPGRDGSRVPLPWSGAAPPYGFGATGDTWLPQPTTWADLTVEAQQRNPASTLRLYRDALRVRKAEPALGDGTLTWLDAPADVLAFRRGDDVACVVNLSAGPVGLPQHEEVLLASADLDDGRLGSDAAVWLRLTTTDKGWSTR